MSLSAGTRIGPYEILAPLGSGGMGEVYRATDTHLGRHVAIKVLPDAFARDADRVARLEREARTLATLNHPNIAAIYGLEKSEGVDALVMELVDGPTLADRVARAALPLDESLAVATQIADALEAAHEQGIIHRDLKPVNIKLRPDGVVKVLDFGLAKLVEPGPSPGRSELTASPTITSPALMTGAGMILGTAAYMSPEQAKGRPADRRSDLWAFGCVLYEMLTARRAFPGADVSDTLATVLKREPDWTALPAGTPTAIRRLLRRCLEKESGRRLRDIADARIEIEDASAPPDVVPTPTGTSARLPWLLMTLAVVVATVLDIGWRFARAPTDAPETRFEILTPPPTDPTAFALSEDGRQLAFVAAAEGGPQLWVRRLDLRRVTLDASRNQMPLWSPDGRAVVFESVRPGQSRGGGLFEKPATGAGDKTAVRDAGEDARPQAWSPDGRFLLYAILDPKTGADLWGLQVGGDRKPFPVVQTPVDEGAGQFSPDGQWIAYESNETGRLEIYVRPFPAPGGTWKVSTAGGSRPRWRRDGKELFYVASDGRLMAVPIVLAADTKTLQPGPPVPLFQTRFASGAGISFATGMSKPQYAVAPDGRFLMNVPVDEATVPPITVALNWDAALKK